MHGCDFNINNLQHNPEFIPEIRFCVYSFRLVKFIPV